MGVGMGMFVPSNSYGGQRTTVRLVLPYGHADPGDQT